MRFPHLASTLFALTLPGVAAAQAGGAFPLAEGDGITFDQVVYDTDEGSVRSSTGRITVNPAQVAEVLGEPSGFINVRTARGWIGVNIPVQTRPQAEFSRGMGRYQVEDTGADLPVTFYFDLGTDRAMRGVNATVLFSPEPLLQKTEFAKLAKVPTMKFRLKTVHQTVNEDGLGVAVPGPGPLPPAPMNPTVTMPDPLMGYWARSTPNPVNIESGRNQCVPIATANALGYLRQTYGQTRGFFAPHELEKGVVDGLELPAELDSRMRRPVQHTCSGSGTGYCPDFPGDSSLLDGVARYLWMWNDANRINLRYQGTTAVNDELCNNDLDLPLANDGAEPTFEWLCDRIEAGDGIVLLYHRYDENDEYTGGHAIRMHGCGMMGGVPFIRVLNDTRQDRMEDDVCVERDGLESQMVFLEDLDNDGRLNYGGNLQREVVFALAISIDP